jgi:hypothetical protein
MTVQPMFTHVMVKILLPDEFHFLIKQTVFDGVISQVSIRFHGHFLQNTATVSAHGFDTDEQFVSDGGGRLASSQFDEYLEFAV